MGKSKTNKNDRNPQVLDDQISTNGLACWFGAFGGLDSDWNPPKMKGGWDSF